MENAVEVHNLSKSFGTVRSNQDITLCVNRGEILSLLGENGSGKSTFVNMLAGIYMPESGTISINGQIRHFTSPQDAISAGIGMIHQHFKLVEVMTALENITLGEKNASFFINRQKTAAKIQNVIKQFGLSVDLNKQIQSMSVSEKQTVEIIKILYQGARILILDEPTAVLTPQETKKLFDTLRKMKAEGCSIIIITHKLNEVMDISDRVAVLNKGHLTGTAVTKETNEEELAKMMLGEKISLEYQYVKADLSSSPMLCVKNLTYENKNGTKKIDNISFELYGGEMLGIAGIVGSGQKELCEILTGLKAATGSAEFCQQELLKLTPRKIKELGIRMNFVPEDRLGMGLAGGMDITDNLMLRSYNKTKGIFIDRKTGGKNAEEAVKKYGISTPSIHSSVRQLSGGNIQKVLLARELEMHPKLLIVSYPFRGLDIGAANTIIETLNAQKKQGIGILLVAEDLDQLCAISDRVMVMHDGKNMGIVDPRKTTKEKIGLMMMGKNNFNLEESK